jgi:hypothetical protein
LLKFGAYGTFIVYIFIAVAFLLFGFFNYLFLLVGLCLILLAALAFLYLQGLNTENECMMLPFLVSELIVRLLIGFVMIISWVVYLLYEFEQVEIESPIGMVEFVF